MLVKASRVASKWGFTLPASGSVCSLEFQTYGNQEQISISLLNRSQPATQKNEELLYIGMSVGDTLAIIIGAGASHDAAEAGVSEVRGEWITPLVNQLFENRPSFNAILKKVSEGPTLSGDIGSQVGSNTGLETVLSAVGIRSGPATVLTGSLTPWLSSSLSGSERHGWAPPKTAARCSGPRAAVRNDFSDNCAGECVRYMPAI